MYIDLEWILLVCVKHAKAINHAKFSFLAQYIYFKIIFTLYSIELPIY